MNKVKLQLSFLLILILFNSCSISLIPGSSKISYFDLDLSDNLDGNIDLCSPQKTADSQILIFKIKTERPYDSYNVYHLETSGNLIPLETVQWVSPLSSLYPAKLEGLLLDSCKLPNSFPLFTTDISSQSMYTVEIKLIFARISTDADGAMAEAKITASMRSEESGKLIAIKSNTSIMKSGLNPSQKDLILNLQKAIQAASLQSLHDLMHARY